MIETANNPTSNTLARLAALVEQGGPVVVVLLLLSVIALTIVLVKVWQFRQLGIRRRQFIEPALREWREGRTQAAYATLQEERSPIAAVMLRAMRGCADSDTPEATVREDVERIARGYLSHLRGSLKGLEVIGTLSPLLGLLGTVLGMIDAFQQLELAGHQVDPSILSGGIWEALLTTAVGLVVAIPAVAALNGLEQAIERFRHALEDAVTQVFTQSMPVSDAA